MGRSPESSFQASQGIRVAPSALEPEDGLRKALRHPGSRAKGDGVTAGTSPVARQARSIATYAIRRGKLIRQPCEVCSSGRAHAHHDDYSKPLEIRWLCPKHHQQFHRSPEVKAVMKAKNASIAPVQIDIDDVLTAKEAAAIAHTSAGTIYNWAKVGYFMSWTVKRHQALERGARYIDSPSFLAFLQNGPDDLCFEVIDNSKACADKR